MTINLDSIRKLHPAQTGWEFAAVTLFAVTGLLATLAVAVATSLNFAEMPF